MTSDVTLSGAITQTQKTAQQSIKLAEDFTQFLTLPLGGPACRAWGRGAARRTTQVVAMTSVSTSPGIACGPENSR